MSYSNEGIVFNGGDVNPLAIYAANYFRVGCFWKSGDGGAAHSNRYMAVSNRFSVTLD